MADFINTVDVVGDDVLTDSIIDRSVTEYNDNRVTAVCRYAFGYCEKLTSVNIPNATTLVWGAFQNCASLVNIIAPAVVTSEDYSFNGCSALTNVKLESLSAIKSSTFGNCKSLRIADFPVASSIGNRSFQSCSSLIALVLRITAGTVYANSSSCLSGTPIASGTGYIYVPSDLVDRYKSATNWSTYAAQFRALEDYTVDGTVTGELDPNKI